MSAIRKLAIGLAISAVAVSACFDGGDRSVGPNAPRLRSGIANSTSSCTANLTELTALANAVFGEGSPNVNSVLGKLDNLRKKVEGGQTEDGYAQANNIVSFVRDKAEEGRLVGTREQIDQFIAGVLCYAGLSPNTYLILPSDEPQVRIAEDGLSGVSLEASPVGVPTLLTFNTLDPEAPSPLDTKLDQYPTYVNITVSSAIRRRSGSRSHRQPMAISSPAPRRSRRRLCPGGSRASRPYSRRSHSTPPWWSRAVSVAP